MRLQSKLCWHLAVVAMAVRAHSAEVAVANVGQVSYASCSIDLHRDRLSFHWKNETGQIYGALDALANAYKAQGKRVVCATNAGIFEESQKPLGLYVEGGKEIRHLNVRKNAYGNFYLEPNGVMAIFVDHAAIWTTAEFQGLSDEERQRIVSANQSGPILLHNGEINPLFAAGSPNATTRNAVCLKSPTDVILVAALNPVNFYDFSTVLKNHFGCRSALYLDGTVSNFYPAQRLEFKRTLGPLIAVTEP